MDRSAKWERRHDSLAIIHAEAMRDGHPFVGRQRELSTLLCDLEAAEAGHGGLALVTGDAGMGKTQVATELARVAEQRGTRVVWTRCLDGAAAGSPWAHITRQLTVARDDIRSVGAQTAGDGDLGALMPLLVAVASGKPLLLVLDDLHLADEASLTVLGSVARTIRDQAILLIGAYREREAARRPVVFTHLGQLTTETRRIPLGGLNDEEVAGLIEMCSGAPPPSTLAAEIGSQTNGNPFFVAELVKLLVAEGHFRQGDMSASVPNGVRVPIPSAVSEGTAARLSAVSAECAEVVGVAAVIGPSSELPLVEAATGLAPPAFLMAIEEASAAGLLEPSDGTGVHFSAPLVRDAIYQRLGPGRRAALHRRVGEAMERLSSASPRPPFGPIADHLLCGVQAGDRGAAIHYGTLAGDEARAEKRYGDAAAWYVRALDVFRGADDEPGQRCELLLALGDVQAEMGEVGKARDTFLAAVHLSRDRGTTDQLARAVLGVGGRLVRLDAVVDHELITLLEEALERVGGGNDALRATLLARLSRALHCADAQARRISLSVEALSLARRAGDPRAQIAALHSRYWALSGADDLAERLAVATEMVELAEKIGDEELALQGHHWRMLQLAEGGDMVSAFAEVRTYGQLAERLQQPLYAWFSLIFRGAMALLGGRFDDAEASARQAVLLGERTHNPFARRYFDAQLFCVRREQGRLDELPDEVDGADLDASGLSRTKRALRWCATGAREAAEVDFGVVAARDFGDLARGLRWTAQLTMLAEVCSHLGDVRRAEQLYDLLLPYRERNAVVGSLLGSNGAVSHYLGLLAATCRRQGQAAGHFEHALAFNERMGARCRLARTQYEYARVLAATAGGIHASDVDRALHLATRAATTAQETGMRELEHDARDLQSLLGGSPGPQPEGAAPPVPKDSKRPDDGDVFRRDGDYLSVQYEGTGRVLRDTKGLHYLHLLLRHPGREFHVVDLARLAAGGHPGRGAWPPRLDPADGMLEGLSIASAPEDPLDNEARRRYRQRLLDLEEDLAEAQRFHDQARAAKTHEEIDFLTAELAECYRGNTNGPRWDNTSERTRKAVTNRIRDAIRRLNQEQPRLGDHLSRTVRTGTFCAYSPERPRRWRL